MLHGHRDSPPTLVMEDALVSPTLSVFMPSGVSALTVVFPDSCLLFPTSSSPPDSPSTTPSVGIRCSPLAIGSTVLHYGDSIPDGPARTSVAIPTELPGPHIQRVTFGKVHRAFYKVSVIFRC
jgi:hypothetical protein